MRNLLLPAFCALAFAACTGNQKPNGKTSEIAGNETVVTIDAALAENSETSMQSTERQGVQPVFLLGNHDGSKFLLNADAKTSSDNVPDSLKNYKYILYEGKYYAVDFKGFQQKNESEDNGRDTPLNFDNLPGWIFALQSGQLLTDTDEYAMFWGKPLLVDECFKSKTKLVKVVRANESATNKFDKLQAEFEKRYNRKITKFKVDSYVGDYTYLIMQFETIDSKALGVVALVKPDGGTIVREFPAEWNEISVWREADEGEFFGLDVDFATIEHGALNLYTISNGEEGTGYQNYVVQGDSLVKGSISNYFYHAQD
ncbi:MAG: hypothetical protein IKW77_02345 [Salinivirgaceae bacterium]|nr:hypothetical protein [Salinivirgaceae bacterium]